MVVKRLRLRPFTAATRVRVPSGSPPYLLPFPYGGIAQPVERPPHTRKVTDSSSVVSTTKSPKTERFWAILLYFHNLFHHFTLQRPKKGKNRLSRKAFPAQHLIHYVTHAAHVSLHQMTVNIEGGRHVAVSQKTLDVLGVTAALTQRVHRAMS